jgi:putative endonuclease
MHFTQLTMINFMFVLLLISRNLKSHNTLAHKGFTTIFHPWKLIYSEEYNDKNSAILSEKELKSHKGRDFLRTLI